MFDAGTEGNRTLIVVTVLRMIAAQSNELFADGTSSILLLLAGPCVLHDFLHLGTRRQMTIFVFAATSVDQGLYTALDAFFLDPFCVDGIVGSL